MATSDIVGTTIVGIILFISFAYTCGSLIQHSFKWIEKKRSIRNQPAELSLFHNHKKKIKLKDATGEQMWRFMMNLCCIESPTSCDGDSCKSFPVCMMRVDEWDESDLETEIEVTE